MGPIYVQLPGESAQDRYDFVGQKLLPGNFISLGVVQGIPFLVTASTFRLRTWRNKPAVDTRYFLHPLDLDIMAYNLLDVEKLHKVEPLSQCPKLNGRSSPTSSLLSSTYVILRRLRTIPAAPRLCYRESRVAQLMKS